MQAKAEEIIHLLRAYSTLRASEKCYKIELKGCYRLLEDLKKEEDKQIIGKEIARYEGLEKAQEADRKKAYQILVQKRLPFLLAWQEAAFNIKVGDQIWYLANGGEEPERALVEAVEYDEDDLPHGRATYVTFRMEKTQERFYTSCNLDYSRDWNLTTGDVSEGGGYYFVVVLPDLDYDTQLQLLPLLKPHFI